MWFSFKTLSPVLKVKQHRWHKTWQTASMVNNWYQIPIARLAALLSDIVFLLSVQNSHFLQFLDFKFLPARSANLTNSTHSSHTRASRLFSEWICLPVKSASQKFFFNTCRCSAVDNIWIDFCVACDFKIRHMICRVLAFLDCCSLSSCTWLEAINVFRTTCKCFRMKRDLFSRWKTFDTELICVWRRFFGDLRRKFVF